jgi:hypothetical protein
VIREIIIPQMKPVSTGNSYFRKMGEKRRWGRLIRSELLRNPARYFYNHLASQSNSWAVGNYVYFYGQSGIYTGINGSIRYNSMTGRLRLCSSCLARRKIKTKRLIRRLQRRNSRRYKGAIANGSGYKRLHLNCTY